MVDAPFTFMGTLFWSRLGSRRHPVGSFYIHPTYVRFHSESLPGFYPTSHRTNEPPRTNVVCMPTLAERLARKIREGKEISEEEQYDFLISLQNEESAGAVSKLRASSAFRDWKPERPTSKEKMTEEASADGGLLDLNQNIAEKHYTPRELAAAWGVSVQTIRGLFKDEPGVLKVARTHRTYKTLRIPESVAERVHTRLSA